MTSKELILPPENNTEKLVREAVGMRLSGKEGVQYCQNYGVKIELASYYNIQAKVKKDVMKRLSERSLKVQHDDRITMLDKGHTELWKNYYEFKAEGDRCGN